MYFTIQNKSFFTFIVILLATASSTVTAQEGGQCIEEESALEGCNAAYGCDYRCRDQVASRSRNQVTPTESKSSTDWTIMVEQAKTQFQESCDYFQHICQSKSCCPECARELDEAYECVAAEMQEAMATELVLIVQKMEASEVKDMPDITFDCSPKLEDECLEMMPDQTLASGSLAERTSGALTQSDLFFPIVMTGMFAMFF